MIGKWLGGGTTIIQLWSDTTYSTANQLDRIRAEIFLTEDDVKWLIDSLSRPGPDLIHMPDGAENRPLAPKQRFEYNGLTEESEAK